MKKKISEILQLIKNNKKKSIIICIMSVVVLIIIGIVLMNFEKRSASSGNVASSNEITTKENETSKENVSETTSAKVHESATTENNSEATTLEETSSNPEATDNNQVNIVPGAGKLKVTGNHLTDEAGNLVQLKGLSTHGIAWYPDYINENSFREFHDNFGINVIRLAMYTAEYNGYCSGGDKNYLKDLVDKGVRYATENQMYVIIDWHILSDGNPNTYKSDAIEFFEEMSSKYASYDNVLYEICNEPNGGTSWNDIKAYAIEVINVIRKNDKDGIIIVGTPNWCQYVDQAAAAPITGYENIMYSLHFYAATHTDSLRNTMESAINAGLPLFVTEFGICDASGNGGIDENQASKWISLLNKYSISYAMWNISNKSETSAIINNSCSKVSGFSVEDLSLAGKWFLKLMQGSVELPKAEENSGSANNNQQVTNAQITEQQTTASNNRKQTIAAEYKANLSNSWQANGKTYYQYDLIITNNSGVACENWSTDVKFSESFTVENSWNGNFTLDGNVLHITSVDYNGNLENGKNAGNIGIIVAGSSNLKLQ